MLEIAVKLFAVTLVMVGGLLLAARANRSRGGPGSGIRVTGRHGLSKGAVVAVVQVDGRRFLVGAGDSQISMLTELDPAKDVESIEVGVADAEGVASLGRARTGSTATRVAGFLAAARRHSRPLHRMERSTTTPGPRIGPVDRLRAMTVRSHVSDGERTPLTRPIHVDDPPS